MVIKIERVMKKILISALIIFAFIAVGCNKSELDPQQENNYTITARISDFGTKTSVFGNTVNWEEGDQISVFANDGSNVLFSIKEGAGGKPVADFQTLENVEGKIFVAALYPYNSIATYSDGKISTSLNNESVWEEGMNTKAPMAAIVNDPKELNFRNAGAMIALSVNNIPAGFNKIEMISSGIAINGAAVIDFTEDGPVCKLVSEDEGNKKTTIKFNRSVANTNKVFYFPLGVTSQATDIAIKLYDGENAQVLTTKTMPNALRNSRYYRTVSFDAKGYLPVEANASDINEMIEAGNSNFTLPTNCVELDITSPTTEELQIAVTANSNLFTLKGEGAKGKINLCIADQVKNLILDVPNASVEIRPDASVAAFGTITATTAENTLTIPNGVTVNNLFVKGGNVRVHGEIINIANQLDKSDRKVTIYVEEGGKIPEGLSTEDFEIIDYANGGYPTTEDELIAAIANASAGDVIHLGKDITLYKGALVIDKAITLDGGNHTITSTDASVNGRCINVKSAQDEVVIKNINIVGVGERGINVIQNAKKVTVLNSTISAGNYAFNVASSAPNAVIVIENSSIIGLNAVNIAGKETSVTINDSHIVCNDRTSAEGYSAIAINKDGIGTIVNMKDGSITVKDDSYVGSVVYGSISFNGTRGDTDKVKDVNYIIDYPGNYYYSFNKLEDAIAKVNAGETIKVMKDVTITKAVNIPSDKSFTFDLNGKTITMDAEDGATAVTDINNYGKVTVKNGTIKAEKKELSRRCIYNKEGGEMVITDMKFIQTYHPKGAAINNEGTMEINNTVVDAIYYSLWMSGSNSKTTVNSGTFVTKNNVEDRTTWAYTVRGSNGSQLIINDGSFTGNHGVIAMYGSNSKATLNKGTYNCTAEYTGNSDWVLYASGTNAEIKYKKSDCTITSNNPNGFKITEEGGTITEF